MNTVLRNSIFLLIGEGIRLFCIFVLLIAAARELGAFGYGQFSYAYAVGSILGIVAILGLPDVLTREIVQRRKEHLFSVLLAPQIGLAALILAVLGGAIAAFLWRDDPVVAKILLLLLFFFFAQVIFLFISAFLRARQRMDQEALVRAGGALLLLGMGFAALNISPGVEQFAASYAAAGVLAAAGTLLLFHIRVQSLRLHFSWSTWKEFFFLSWPVGITVVLGSVLGSIDSVMLGLMGQVTETGWYNAAYRIASLGSVPASLIGAAFFPVLSHRFVSSANALRGTFFKYATVMAVVGVSISAVPFLLAPFLVVALYGQEFAPAGLALRILSGVILMQFFYMSFFFLLLASKRVHFLLFVMGIGVAVNMLLNTVLIPALSLYGAAIASVLSYAFMAVGTGFVSFRKILIS